MTASEIWSTETFSTPVPKSIFQMSSPGYPSIPQQFPPKAVAYPSPNFESYYHHQNQTSNGYSSSSTSLSSPTDYYGIQNTNYQQSWGADFNAFKNSYGSEFWNGQSGANEEVKSSQQRKRVKTEIKEYHDRFVRLLLL